MRTLVISTASPALSLALFEDDRLVAHDHRVIGRGHAEALMPGIAALMTGGPAQQVLVDIGPGSFTGIRIGIAAARALGLVWQVPVRGFSGASLVAARAFAESPELTDVCVLMDGGRGQMLARDYTTDFCHSETLKLAASEVLATGAFAGAGLKSSGCSLCSCNSVLLTLISSYGFAASPVAWQTVGEAALLPLAP